MKTIHGLIVLAALALVAGCRGPDPVPEEKLNLSVLTTALIAKYRVTPDELLKLQYYLDKELVIQRQLGTGEREVAHGKIVVRNGLEVNEVAVEALTQGIALRHEPDGKGLDVGFDPSSPAAFAFGPGASGEYELGVDAQGRVPYDGVTYALRTRGNRLLVDLSSFSRVERTRKTLPGRTIAEPQ